MKINLLNVPVFYINMNKDTHKKEYLEYQLKKLGFKNINRIEAIEDKNNGRVGLSKSQSIALNQVKAPFVILEDDADPKYFKGTIEVPDDADAVYLGNSQWGYMQSQAGFYLKYKPVKEIPDVFRIYNMLSSHAILYLTDEYVGLCKRTTKYCAEVFPMPMDVPFAMIQRFYNIYTINKPLFIQKDYEGKMSAAPKYTNKKLTEYKVFESPEKRDGVFYKDNIIE